MYIYICMCPGHIRNRVVFPLRHLECRLHYCRGALWRIAIPNGMNDPYWFLEQKYLYYLMLRKDVWCYTLCYYFKIGNRK